ncbi:MAG: phosphoribosyl-ATP diphosphatase [Clostridiales bacterium]|nr:phosphoribosyl-ATP diphosphatase [Clostridiales bacterium]
MADLGKSLLTEFDVILNRKQNPSEGSYTSYLFGKGENKILKKIGEEATEVIIAAKGGSVDELIGEICDVLFHIEVLMAEKGLNWGDIAGELDLRRQKENMNVEKEAKRKAENRTDETTIN